MIVGQVYQVIVGKQAFVAMYQGTRGPYEVFHTGKEGERLLLPGNWEARVL